jgi:DNA gyrase/topoisomerase IV subunit A
LGLHTRSKKVLGDARVTWSVIRAELQELAAAHAVPRRTFIDESLGGEDVAISEEDLLVNERSVRGTVGVCAKERSRGDVVGLYARCGAR